MKTFMEPAINIFKLNVDDVITASRDVPSTGDDDTPWDTQ